MPQITCPCGKEFYASPSKIAKGRGKYCSRDCYYLATDSTQKIICPCGKEFRTIPSEIARRGRIYCSSDCYHSFVRGEATRKWKGDAVTYGVLHRWVRIEKGLPNQCSFCGRTDVPLEWANISHEYRRDVTDWMSLCISCHRRYDRDARLTCGRGHEWTAENTRIRSTGVRSCRTCANESRRARRAAGKVG